tara:strand:+ start:1992 stop:2870 length:879 start_codon:yes stop_codon:yes gene_type:complete
MNEKILILTPVYNDWRSLKKLLFKINQIFKKKLKLKFELLIINDCSTKTYDFKKYRFEMIKKITIISLFKNIGSQRAIAIGLRFLNKKYKKEIKTIILDSDGQDNPNLIPAMLKKSRLDSNYSVVVDRGQRKEPIWFRVLYEFYCFFVKIFCAKKIRFGNFSLINFDHLKKISSKKELWSAYPPTILLNIDKIKHITGNREKRYADKSKMNFFGLVFHALRVFAVLKKKIFFFSVYFSFFIYILFFYNLITYLFFNLISVFIVAFNICINLISLNNKNEFLKNFKKIKIEIF